MQKFNGSLIRQFPSLTTGNAASGVQVSVFISGTNTLATLYATNNTAGAQLGNPITTDSKGFYSFYAADGRYRLQFNNGFPSLEEQLVDVIDINAEFNAAISGLENTVDTLTIVVAGDFQTGTTVTARNQVVLWPISAGGDGREYRWAGALPKTVPAASTPASTGGISDSAWVYTADVALEQALAAPGSTKLVGGVEAGDIALAATNGIASTRQQGLPDSYALGVNFANDAAFAENSESTDKFVNGNMSIGKDLFGVRRNAVTLSVKANGGNKFAPEITGVSGSQQLADYGSADQAAAFFDIQSNDFEGWEVISNPTYTQSGFTAAIDVNKVKVGMVAKTDHPAPYWGIITSFTATGATVDKWSKAGAPDDILPANGTGLKLNPTLKLWALNANVLLLPDGRADLAAVCEFGLVNQKTPDPNGVNGVDMVLLGSSTYDGTAAFLGRKGGGPATWKIGSLMQEASLAGFLSQNSSRGFVATNNPVGYVYARAGGATDRVLSVRNGTDYVTATEVAAIDGSGRVQKLPRRPQVLANGTTMSSQFPLYIFNGSSTINVNLPDPTGANYIDGDIIKIKNAGSTGIIVINGLLVVDGAIASSASLAASRHSYDLVLIGGRWYL